MGRIYIAGPMRGIPGYNFAKFNAWAKTLRSEGWTVINPAELSEAYGNPKEDDIMTLVLMDHELEIIRRSCNAIFLLRGWERSKGARAELNRAIDCGLEIFLEGQQ